MKTNEEYKLLVLKRHGNKYDLEMQINTFSLFYYLFRNTFIKDGKDWKDYEI